MANVGHDWDQMLELAKSQQQEYYELLCDWTKYKQHEYKYLRQNIGFAIFGPPSDNEKAMVVLKSNERINDGDVLNTFYYSEMANKTIDTIYNKVCQFGEGCINEGSIHYGIIYNVIFRMKNSSDELFPSKNNVKDKKDEKDKKDKKEEKDKKDKKEEKDKKDKKEEKDKKDKKEEKDKKDKKEEKDKKDEKDDNKIKIYPLPIFKIRRPGNEVWYIDMTGRVYKNWMDYKENNTLPKCTMVIPKNGFYEPNTNYECTEEYSVALLDVVQSPACSTAATILKGADITSNIVGAVGLGLCVASIFTPAAPLAVGAAVTTGLNGVWTIGRSAQHLADRNSHEESLTDWEALSSWLAITGCTLGIAASGGNVLLNKFIQGGGTIGTATKIAYDTLILSNLGINGFGIAYQAYCMYDRYKNTGEVNYGDAILLTAHILFFGNAVLNAQFATELIKTTQGKILDDYRATLRSKNLRKKFNRARRNAAANNADIISENAEVIRYINRKADLGVQHNSGNISVQKSSVLFEHGKLIISGITLLDPMKFVDILISSDRNSLNETHSNQSNDDNNIIRKLKDVLLALLKQFSSDNANRNVHVPDIVEFNGIFEEMKDMKNAPDIFVLIFKIAAALTSESPSCSDYLAKAVHFIWRYISESLRQNALRTVCIKDAQMERKLSQLIIALFENIDCMMNELLLAFEKYITEHLRMMFA